MGWRRLALVVLVGIGLPLGLYALETRVAPWGSLRYGIHMVLAQRAAELGAAFLLVVFGTGLMAYRAVRQRCAEAGIEVPPRGQFNPLQQRARARVSLVLALALGAAAAALAACAWHGSLPLKLLAATATVAAITFVPIFLVWQLLRTGRTGRPAGDVIRDFLASARRIPLWLAAAGALVLGGLATFLFALNAWLSVWTVALSLALGAALTVVAHACARTAVTAPVRGLAQFRSTLGRSLVPVVATCLLVLVLVAGPYLRYAEARALWPITQPEAHWLDEVGASDLAKYRDHLREANSQWLQDHVYEPVDAGARSAGTR